MENVNPGDSPCDLEKKKVIFSYFSYPFCRVFVMDLGCGHTVALTSNDLANGRRRTSAKSSYDRAALDVNLRSASTFNDVFINSVSSVTLDAAI